MAKEKKVAKVFTVKRVVKAASGEKTKFSGLEYGLANVVGAPVALASLRFLDVDKLPECRFESDAAKDAATMRAWNLARQQHLKAKAMSEDVLQLVQDGKLTEAEAALREVWGKYTYALGAASKGTAQVKVTRTALQALNDKAAQADAMAAELAELRAQMAARKGK